MQIKSFFRILFKINKRFSEICLSKKSLIQKANIKNNKAYSQEKHSFSRKDAKYSQVS
jgi:hypothetical protein